MTFDLQGSYAERGRPMITGAQEVMTLQLSLMEEEEKVELEDL